jgi:hypothetical protein
MPKVERRVSVIALAGIAPLRSRTAPTRDRGSGGCFYLFTDEEHTTDNRHSTTIGTVSQCINTTPIVDHHCTYTLCINIHIDIDINIKFERE